MTWVTDFGGVSTVPEFLRLTVEIRDNTRGSYGQKLDKFENRDDGATAFVIDYVTVYQHNGCEPYIRSAADYPLLQEYNPGK